MNLERLKAGLTKQTIRAQVSERLAAMIQSGLLRPGDELPSERELAATLEVSRETVRGAIQTLAAIGMVESSQGSRTRVIGSTDIAIGGRPRAVPPPKDVQDVHEARQVVELSVMRLTVARIGRGDLDRLARLVDEQRQMLDDPVRFQISDAEFHAVIYRAGGNPRLSNFLIELYSFGLEFRRMAMQHASAVAQSLADHEAILSALNARDPEAAVAMTERHLGRIRDTTMAALDVK